MFLEAATELIGFLAAFLASGAVAFRYVVLRAEAEVERLAARRAALLGLIGALITMSMYLLMTLPRLAARQHTSIVHATVANGPTAIQSICLVLALLGFVLAFAHVRAGWALAAIGVVIAPFASLFFGNWARAINPIHRLSGGLWIGTLFVLLVAGFRTVKRGDVVANMVHRFSPLALTAFAGLALTGIITAWRHLKRLDALWTTPYGYALIAKLCVVAIVIALGAWNWRRQRPLLGTESAATALRRSATYEVAAATVVLVITSVLVSLPSPR